MFHALIFDACPLCFWRRCLSLDELIEPLRMHLVPNLADKFLIGILGGVSKRLELAIRKVPHPLLLSLFSCVNV